MTEASPPKRPALALLGYVATLLPLVAIVAAFQTEALRGLGWRGGQYAQTFVVATVGVMVAGAVLRSRRPGCGWRSFGFGMILAGVTGILTIAGGLALLTYVLSHAKFVF